MEEEIQLMVEKGYPIDIGRGIIRLNPTILLKLQLSPGDIVEIMGKKKTTAKVWRLDREDWNKEITRIDNFVRQNAGVSIGDTVTIKKVQAKIAKKLTLALPESMTQGGPTLQFGDHANEIIKRHILKRPILKGDIFAIVNLVSQPITEESIISQAIPLVVIDTEPSDTIVQIFEETKIELLSNIVQNKEVQNGKVEILGRNENIQYLDRLVNLSHLTTAMQGLADSFKYEKKDNEIDIITLSEAIVKTKDHYEKISSNIKKYNTDYAVENSTTLSILENLVDKSDKAVFEHIYNLKLKDALNYVNELESKQEMCHKVAMSEITHRKIKEIEFQVKSPFFFSKSSKDYRTLVNEISQLDNDGIQGTKNMNDFIVASEQIIKKIKDIEGDLEYEKKSGISHAIKNYFFVGTTALLSFYQLVAVKYVNVNNPYLPIIIFLLLGIMYLLLRPGVSLNILYLAYKNKLLEIRIKLYMTLIFIWVLMVTFVYAFSYFVPQNIFPDIYAIYSFLVMFLVSTLFLIVLGFKDSVQETKSKLIKKEIDALIKKYDLNL